MAAEIILLSKQDSFSHNAVMMAQAMFGSRLEAHSGQVGDPFPEPLLEMRPKVLISFLSPWIVPANVLDASTAAINFHPASADYPGLGCYNFALYEKAAEFGAICHHMLPKVDTGPIIEERRFPIFAEDSVETLKLRTMVTMLSMFHDLCCLIVQGAPLPQSKVQWSRRPFTRKEMNALKQVDAAMSADEVGRRVRATVYPGYPGPSVEIAGHTFFYPVPDRPALA